MPKLTKKSHNSSDALQGPRSTIQYMSVLLNYWVFTQSQQTCHSKQKLGVSGQTTCCLQIQVIGHITLTFFPCLYSTLFVSLLYVLRIHKHRLDFLQGKATRWCDLLAASNLRGMQQSPQQPNGNCVCVCAARITPCSIHFHNSAVASLMSHLPNNCAAELLISAECRTYMFN